MIAKDNNISKTEASNRVIGTNVLGLSSVNGVSSNYLTALNATYRTGTDIVPVNSVYKPYVKFYCQSTEGGILL
ncbi:hypothetical protein KTC96_23930 (plasmid) [Clostridium estertheticum]|uniref:hypothetical protein n=1 Tax=Clostridium estertheticum TaxID=238834 RepID=UPI001C7CD3BA|nr:hypothetical protein [Clostridium estertheticum]MBX4262178.1 hypothetical protein [Clostridium estertheticum]WLC73179.1 hypothetical protein KTC96_23930 [Clostridium estertheticum]